MIATAAMGTQSVLSTLNKVSLRPTVTVLLATLPCSLVSLHDSGALTVSAKTA
jgi:hypothetical protein